MTNTINLILSMGYLLSAYAFKATFTATGLTGANVGGVNIVGLTCSTPYATCVFEDITPYTIVNGFCKGALTDWILPAGSELKLLNIDSFDNAILGYRSFYKCEDFTITLGEIPDLGLITETSAGIRDIFKESKFDQDISGWDIIPSGIFTSGAFTDNVDFQCINMDVLNIIYHNLKSGLSIDNCDINTITTEIDALLLTNGELELELLSLEEIREQLTLLLSVLDSDILLSTENLDKLKLLIRRLRVELKETDEQLYPLALLALGSLFASINSSINLDINTLSIIIAFLVFAYFNFRDRNGRFRFPQL